MPSSKEKWILKDFTKRFLFYTIYFSMALFQESFSTKSFLRNLYWIISYKHLTVLYKSSFGFRWEQRKFLKKTINLKKQKINKYVSIIKNIHDIDYLLFFSFQCVYKYYFRLFTTLTKSFYFLIIIYKKNINLTGKNISFFIIHISL